MARKIQWDLGWSDLRINYYLFKSGKLQREDQSIVFYSKNRKDFLPLGQMESIYIFSGVDINQQVLILLNEHNVSIFFFTYNGRYIGRYTPNRILTGQNIINHVHFIDNEVATLKLCETMLEASIKNMLFIARYYQKKRGAKFAFINGLSECLNEIKKIQDSNKFLLLEARAKQLYYEIFDLALLVSDFSFDNRSTQPPLNEFNAIISFGYALLYSRIESSFHRSRLCLELPFQHGYSKKGSGLHHDIADIFKPIMIDRLVLNLINKKVIKIDYFESRNGGVYLTKEGMTRFIEAFDEFMGTTIFVNKKAYTYHQILSREVHAISALINEGKSYKPFILTKW